MYAMYAMSCMHAMYVSYVRTYVCIYVMVVQDCRLSFPQILGPMYCFSMTILTPPYRTNVMNLYIVFFVFNPW